MMGMVCPMSWLGRTPVSGPYNIDLTKVVVMIMCGNVGRLSGIAVFHLEVGSKGHKLVA